MNEATEGKISIMLVDDHPLIRQALRSLLEKEADMEIVAEAGDGDEAVRLAIELNPRVVIMDIGIPKINGIEATRQIKAKLPNIAVLVLTVYDDNEHIMEILAAGAAGYFTKTVFGQEIIQAVRGVVVGEIVLSPSVFQRIIRHSLRYMTKSAPLVGGDKITGRELEILRLAARGLGNRDIAAKLDISLRTAKGYMAQIFSKLNVASRTEAVITALEAGIVSLNDLD